jgi:Uncharacterized protein conserved in bacteria
MTMRTSEKNSFYIGFPKAFQEIRYYGNELLEGQAIIINLSALSIEEQEQCRIFMSGVIFAIKGRMEEISEDVLLIVPPQMELMIENFPVEGLNYPGN